MSWTRVEFTVTTPMFLGGANGADRLRPPALRGALRYWFRAMAGASVGNDLEKLKELEAKVFGSTERSSTVRLRVRSSPRPKSEGARGWLNGQGRWIGYLLGPGLYSDGEVTREFLEPGATGEIEIDAGVDEHAQTIVAICLWCLSVLGGLGARTRRGFGGIRFAPEGLGELGPLLSAPDVNDLLIVRAAFDCALKALAGETLIATEGEPSYPQLTAGRWECRIVNRAGNDGPWGTWDQALSHIGRAFREHRATQTTRRNRRTPEYADIVRPWLKAGALIAPPPDFGLAAFGLPIPFTKHEHLKIKRNGGEIRRASPLWLRVLQPNTNEGWVGLYHAFFGAFLPEEATVELEGTPPKPQEVSIDSALAHKRIKEWLNAHGTPGPTLP